MANYNKINYETIRTDKQIDTGSWEDAHSRKVQDAAVFSETDFSDYNEKYNTMVTMGLVHAITYYSKHPEQARAVKDSTEYPFAARAAFESFKMTDYETIRTDEEIENGSWHVSHINAVQNAAVLSETDFNDYNEKYNEKYNTMVTVGLVHAITYYSKHPKQARAVRDSTEYIFAARAASLALFGPVYEVDTRTDTVVERPALWGGSKRFKKKSRRRRNRKTTRRRRRKY